MKIYLASGTPEFMEMIREKHKKEKMIVMYGEGNTTLLHETEGKTVFQTPRRYEVIDSSGTLEEYGRFAFDNITVTDEGRPVFEHYFKNNIGSIETEPGFIAFRLLRPLTSDTYIILTQWSDFSYFHRWKNSPAYEQVHPKGRTSKGVETTPHIFSSAPYITLFNAAKKEEE
jgi:heme-degrading monooxygenase HmoA